MGRKTAAEVMRDGLGLAVAGGSHLLQGAFGRKTSVRKTADRFTDDQKAGGLGLGGGCGSAFGGGNAGGMSPPREKRPS
jgi:hypothetical protein